MFRESPPSAQHMVVDRLWVTRYGARARNRTVNLGIKSPLLCQLSYAGRILIYCTIEQSHSCEWADDPSTRRKPNQPVPPSELIGCRAGRLQEGKSPSGPCRLTLAPHRSEDPAPNFCPSNRGGMAEEPPELWLPTGDPSKQTLFLEPEADLNPNYWVLFSAVLLATGGRPAPESCRFADPGPPGGRG